MIQWFKCLFKGHEWSHVADVKVFGLNSSTRPLYIKRTYQCKKCLKAKRVKI